MLAFLAITGIFTWLYGSDIFFTGQASLQPFFSVAYWTLFFFCPALCMRTVAEEKKTGTLELLLTRPIDSLPLVLGKFSSCLCLIILCLCLTLPYYVTVANLGPLDNAAVLCGYLGMILVSSCYIGIGILASSLSENQVVSFIMALSIGLFFVVIFDLLSSSLPGGMASSVFDYLSLSGHYESISRGVLDTRDFVYFGSIIASCLGLSAVFIKSGSLLKK